MTIALQYLGDLSRVRISLSDLPDGTVQVQRALNSAATDAIWEQGVVRGGRALPVSAGVAVLDDHEFAPDVQNFYRVVPIDPPAGLLLTGDDGDYASTPDTAALDITGDIDIRAHLTVSSWQAESHRVIAAKYGSDLPFSSWIFYITPEGELGFYWDPDGTGLNDQFAETSAPLSDLSTAVRVTLDVDNAGDYQVTFYTGSSMSGPWQEFETVDGSGTTQINASSAALEVGSLGGGTSELLDGVVHALQVRDGIDGTLVADVDFTAQSPGTTQFTDDAGRVWTVHGDARIIGVEVASITPSLDGRVWLKSIRYPGLNRPLFRVLDQGDDIARPDRGSVHEVTGRAAPISVEDVQGSRRFTLLIQAEDDDQAAALEIMLQVGGVLFIHVPPDKPVPGGHVHVGQVRRQRPTTLVRHRFVVPCTVVAKPAPDVVGTTLTVGQLIAEHGSIESVWATYPSIRDMWDDIGDINDLVVI